ncbi:MAG: TonB-dependent receptor plug domain-containing protein, partial [Deltaproteobacteria bacterium]|nr:TonB-dependent receptor plug domain-containing protein [Deltaproteobacteria bacterium]
MTIRVALLVCALFAGFVAEAIADDEPGAGTDGKDLDEYKVTARRVNESLADPPVFVEVIDMSEYEGRFVTTPEVLARAVGVNVRDFGGLGRLSTVSIRGASAEQVVVLVDGVRVNPASGGGVDLSSIPPAHIE